MHQTTWWTNVHGLHHVNVSNSTWWTNLNATFWSCDPADRWSISLCTLEKFKYFQNRTLQYQIALYTNRKHVYQFNDDHFIRRPLPFSSAEHYIALLLSLRFVGHNMFWRQNEHACTSSSPMFVNTEIGLCWRGGRAIFKPIVPIAPKVSHTNVALMILSSLASTANINH